MEVSVRPERKEVVKPILGLRGKEWGCRCDRVGVGGVVA